MEIDHCPVCKRSFGAEVRKCCTYDEFGQMTSLYPKGDHAFIICSGCCTSGWDTDDVLYYVRSLNVPAALRVGEGM